MESMQNDRMSIETVLDLVLDFYSFISYSLSFIVSGSHSFSIGSLKPGV